MDISITCSCSVIKKVINVVHLYLYFGFFPHDQVSGVELTVSEGVSNEEAREAQKRR